MSSIYARRFFNANNKYLEDYNPEEPSSYLLNIDANNLYGGIVKHCPLPIKDFSIVEESLKYILQTDDKSEWGYFWKWISVYLKNFKITLQTTR